MDHPKLAFFLLLIVAGTATTLGSPVKDEYSDDEELEALLIRSNRSNPIMEKDDDMTPNNQGTKDLPSISSNQGREKGKRKLDKADVIAGSALGVVVLDAFLKNMASSSRKIAIGIDNESGCKWTALNVYFYSGTSDVVMPHEVDSGKAFVYGARKTSYVARGAVGVMSYYIPSIDHTLAVMFSVPFDYNWYENWWDVKLCKGKKYASYSIYKEMYNADPYKGDNSWYYRHLGFGLGSKGYMSSSGQAKLEIHVYRE